MTPIRSFSPLIALLIVLCVPGCNRKPFDENGWKQKGAETLKPFRINLKQALMDGLAKGPAEAIDVCRLQAPQIADSLSGPKIKVGRTSHKLRNPKNKPSAWLALILQDYVDKRSDGPRVVRLKDDRVGYVEPIKTQAMCLTCHGESIAPDIQQALSRLYPNDQATGFELDEFRGLFWVEFQE